MTRLVRHALIGVVLILACLRAEAADESARFRSAWASDYVGGSAPVSSMARLLMERDPSEAPTKPDAERRPGPPASGPDWRGAARDAAYFVGYQFVGVAVLATLPESVSGWSDEDKKNGFKEWKENVSKMVWDEDGWVLNYVTHPYWGGTYYIRGRERGLDRWQSFWYSALLSTLWEYGVEAVAEPVSIQDMIVTPVFGSLVGEYLFSPWRAHIRAKGGPLSFSDKAVMVLTDPLGTVNEQIDRWLGVKTSLQLQPVVARPPVRHPGLAPPVPAQKTVIGWRLQLQMAW